MSNSVISPSLLAPVKLSRLSAALINSNPAGVVVDHGGFKFTIAVQEKTALGSYVVKSQFSPDYPAGSVVDASEWVRICVLVEKEKNAPGKNAAQVVARH